MTTIILAVAATIAAATAPFAATGREYHIASPVTLADTSFTATTAAPIAAVEARMKIDNPRRLRHGDSPAWAEMTIGGYRLIIRSRAEVADNIDDASAVRLTLMKGDSVMASAACKDLGSGFTTYSMTHSADSVTVAAGRRELSTVMTAAAAPGDYDHTASLTATGRVEVALLMTESPAPSLAERLTAFTPAEADSLLAAPLAAPLGLYRYLDRSADPAYARLGGRYTVALLPAPDAPGELLIIYIAGAEVEPDLWQRGMVKGRLRPTPFVGQYDLEWNDSHGNPVYPDGDSYALYDSSARTLTLRFPALEGAELRFAGV